MNRSVRLGGSQKAAVLAFGMAMVGGDCDGEVAHDPTFRDWCGATLCAWKLDAGRIQPAPTWNANDFGVSFVVEPTEISQATTESNAKCLLFTTVADIDPSAQMTLAVDFDSDGSFEYAAPLGAAAWEKVETEITAPASYQGITFVIRKAGTGTAILAELRIQSTTGCTGPPVTITPTSLALGERCADASECAAGLTCAGDPSYFVCAECSTAQACPAAASCTARSVFLPLQCGPGESLGAAGDPCLAGSDCASGACLGAMPVALDDDAGTCDLEATIGPGDPTNCDDYGARGGSCR